jgi:hypothetical protein
MDIMTIIILAFATWRIASLFAREAGPWDIFEKIRVHLGVIWDVKSELIGTTMLSKMIVCVWCNSIWFGGFWTVAYLISPMVVWLALPFAISAGAVLLDCIVGESYEHR